MSIVYDSNPDREYDPVPFARPQPGSAPEKPGRSLGFGGVTARRMLEHDRPAKHPWLSVELAQKEIAMQEHQRDRAAVFEESIA